MSLGQAVQTERPPNQGLEQGQHSGSSSLKSATGGHLGHEEMRLQGGLQENLDLDLKRQRIILAPVGANTTMLASATLGHLIPDPLREAPHVNPHFSDKDTEAQGSKLPWVTFGKWQSSNLCIAIVTLVSVSVSCSLTRREPSRALPAPAQGLAPARRAGGSSPGGTASVRPLLCTRSKESSLSHDQLQGSPEDGWQGLCSLYPNISLQGADRRPPLQSSQPTHIYPPTGWVWLRLWFLRVSLSWNLAHLPLRHVGPRPTPLKTGTMGQMDITRRAPNRPPEELGPI